MKFYYSQLSKLIKSIKENDISAILLYGTNRGLINIITEEIVDNLSLQVREINLKSVSLPELKFVANNRNFFSEKEFIKIISNSDINADIQNWLSKEKISNLVCFCYYDLTPNQRIRELFEKSINMAAIKCYIEEKSSVAALAVREAQKHKKKFTKEALEIVKNYLIGDQKMILSELNKLFLYVHDKDIISEDHVVTAITENSQAAYDDLCFFFASSQNEKFLSELQKFRDANANDIQILRALMKYYTNLYIVLAKNKLTSCTEESMKLISPPIFFKHIESFKIAVEKSQISEVTNMLELLYKIEIKCKDGEIDPITTLLLNRAEI